MELCSGQLIPDHALTVHPIRQCLYSPDGMLLAQQNDDGTRLSIHTDHLGTPCFASDSNQTMALSWIGDAFGTTPANEDPDGNGNTVTILSGYYLSLPQCNGIPQPK